MSISPAARLGRAVLGAGASTGVALGCHVIGGGHAPAFAGWAVPLALSFVVCLQFAGKSLSLWRLSVSILASQGLFHFLFVLGSSSIEMSGEHAHHGGPLTVTGVSSMDHGEHGGVVMTLAHLAAAVVTIFALYRAEWLLERGAFLARWLQTVRLLPEPLQVPILSLRVVKHLYVNALTPALGDFAGGSCPLRGPPATP